MEQNATHADWQENLSHILSVIGILLVLYSLFGTIGGSSSKTMWYVTLVAILIAQLCKLWSKTIDRQGKKVALIILGILFFLLLLICVF
jgi:hypothetical protein